MNTITSAPSNFCSKHRQRTWFVAKPRADNEYLEAASNNQDKLLVRQCTNFDLPSIFLPISNPSADFFQRSTKKKLWKILEYNDILLIIYAGKGQEGQCKQKLCKISKFFNQLSYNIVHKGSHKKLDNTASSGKKKIYPEQLTVLPI